MVRFPLRSYGPADLVQGDALEVLLNLAESGRRFGAVLTDPPYSSGGNVRDKAGSTAARYLGRSSRRLYPEFQGDTRDQRSFLAWSTLWMGRARDLVEPGGLIAVFSDWRQLPVTTDALQCAGWFWCASLDDRALSSGFAEDARAAARRAEETLFKAMGPEERAQP